jgi:hypothetical protein
VDQRALGLRLVLVVGVVDHRQDLDGTEPAAQTAKGREVVGVDLWHAAMMPVASLVSSSCNASWTGAGGSGG